RRRHPPARPGAPPALPDDQVGVDAAPQPIGARRMTKEEIRSYVADFNEEALLADGFEDAFVGVGQRCSQVSIAVYDTDKCIEILMQRDGMTEEDAIEFFEFNTLGAWAGEGTPMFLSEPA